MKTGSVIAILAIATLCASAMAQENSAEDWFNRGQELQRNDSHEEALQAFDKAIEINQSYAFAWGGKGYVLYNMGRYEESIAAWDRAIELVPDEFYSGSKWEMKGKALEILGWDIQANPTPLKASGYSMLTCNLIQGKGSSGPGTRGRAKELFANFRELGGI